MDEMRIALINPSFSRYGGIKGQGGNAIPLNLCYLAAYVRDKHTVKIFDAEVNKWTHSQTVTEVTKFKPDIIGITTNTPVFSSAIELTKCLKLTMPTTPIIMGGSHVSALPEQSLEEAKIDIVIIGEGELAFNDVVSSVKINRIHERELIENLDTLPFPARDLLDNSLYSPPPTKRVSNGAHTLLSTSRGCPFNCGFCATQTVWGRKTRIRSPISVVAEIEECVDRYGINSFSFTDELFTFSKERVSKICNFILDRNLNINWVCSARAQGLDTPLLKLMKRAGCVEISFGIESGNNYILTNIGKQLDLTEAQCVIARVKSVGITTHASYMFGYIGETINTMEDTLRLAKKLNTDYAAFFIASPLPGTRLYQQAFERGYIRKNVTWLDYAPLSNSKPVLELPTVPSWLVNQYHKKAIKEYYFRWKYVIARLLRIRHWYEIVNIWKGLRLYATLACHKTDSK